MSRSTSRSTQLVIILPNTAGEQAGSEDLGLPEAMGERGSEGGRLCAAPPHEGDKPWVFCGYWPECKLRKQLFDC